MGALGQGVWEDSSAKYLLHKPLIPSTHKTGYVHEAQKKKLKWKGASHDQKEKQAEARGPTHLAPTRGISILQQ